MASFHSAPAWGVGIAVKVLAISVTSTRLARAGLGVNLGHPSPTPGGGARWWLRLQGPGLPGCQRAAHLSVCQSLWRVTTMLVRPAVAENVGQ